MGIYSDAFDKARARLLRESKYEIKAIILRGKSHVPLICEKRLERILNFKGRGERRNFLDLIKEVEELAYNEMARAWDKGDILHTPWIDEYIIENNFQVFYNKGDIVFKKRN